MSKEIFISYSRRDTEFVTRLAGDLDAHVAGVWFDQSTIQAGQNWHDEIMDGIRDCKAFVLVLSPDSMESHYVREEVNKALELGKTIFPILYRPAKWTGEFESLVKDIQTLDLRSGSYTDDFQKLVDGLIEAGAVKATSTDRPFQRGQTKIGLNVVFSKIPAWAFAWSLGWLVFSIIVFIFLFIGVAIQGKAGWDDALNSLAILFSGMTGGFAGGLIAGLFTMLALRPNAPSISWKHMSPTIRIWGISGPLGMIVSGVITVTLAIGAIASHSAIPDCVGIGLAECINQASQAEYRGVFILIMEVFLLFGIASWFLTGMFAGWLAVRHIRRLEPGITNKQGWSVSAGWGCGAIIAAIVMILLFGLLASALRL